MNKIIFTGGGSAGHVTLNLELIPFFLEKGWKVTYIGSYGGIEKDLVKKFEQIEYKAIQTGKLRRYFSWKNLVDALRIPIGIIQAVGLVLQQKPNVIFSKGGFVSFPVVVAGFLCGVPVVMHESDVTPGLANKMSLPFVSKFFTTFEDTIKYVKDKSKVDCVGPVISDRFKGGNKKRALSILQFKEDKPIIMFMGGSLGAKSLNEAVRKNIAALLQKYQVIHLCGKGQEDASIQFDGYRQFEYVDKELKDFMKAADIVISRAGSNAIFELLSQNKPMVLVPLPVGSSRGEQMLNAKSFQAKGYCEIIADEDLIHSQIFMETVDKVYKNKDKYISAMKNNIFHSMSNIELARKIESFIK